MALGLTAGLLHNGLRPLFRKPSYVFTTLCKINLLLTFVQPFKTFTHLYQRAVKLEYLPTLGLCAVLMSV